MPLRRSFIQSVRSAAGAENCLDCPEDLRCYSYDLFARGYPDLVVLPTTTEQTAAVLKLADVEGVAVTPRGAASSLTGGPVPLQGGIALCFTRMNRILEIDPVDRLARVQPGVITWDLQKAVARLGLFYPPNPTSSRYCTMGGNTATNAGGPSGVKYGVTRDYLLGLSLAVPGGEVLVTGGRALKNVTGYDFTHFLCGSEGMLGALTEITVRLIPQPESVRTLLAYHPDVETAVHNVTEVLARGIVPSTMELMDGNFMAAVSGLYDLQFPHGAGAALLIEVDGFARIIDEQSEAVAEVCERSGALKTYRASNAVERERLWTARRMGTAALVRSSTFLVTLDFSVPISRIPRAVKTIQDLGREHGLKVVIIGHAGDGNLHPMFIYDPGDPDQMHAYRRVERSLGAAMVALGGTLTGEHGVGLEKAAHLKLEKSAFELELSRRVKRTFDPHLIMNPGKCEWAAP